MQASEFIFVGLCYTAATLGACLFSPPDFFLYLAFAALSGALMLRRRFAIRVICFLVLLCALFGMLYEHLHEHGTVYP